MISVNLQHLRKPNSFSQEEVAEKIGVSRQGYHIDNCIHWMIGTSPGSDLYRLWETVGAVGNGIRIHRFDRMYTSELGGERVTLWQDIDRTEEELLKLSPKDAALKLFREYAGMDTMDLMNRFSNPLIRCMISDFCTPESLAVSFPMAYGNFAGGDGGIPEGGFRAMAQRIK